MNIAFPKSYIVWDLETTGLNPQTCHILEVAVAIVRDGNVVEKWSALLNHGVDIDPKATEIHGITREMCEKEGKNPKEVIERLAKNILDAEAHVTHNGTKFDLLFLTEFIQRDEAVKARGLKSTLEELELHHIDTAALFKGERMGLQKMWRESWGDYFRNVLNTRAPGLKYNVEVCCSELGINCDGVQRHRALGDVLLTNEIYQKLTT